MTKTILFAAHDIAGGRVIAIIADACRAAGYRVMARTRGPARNVLRGDDASESAASALETIRPDAVVTGTSATATLEPDLWIAARRLAIPSLAILDASINLNQRFSHGEPDVICLVDDESRDILRSEAWCTAHLRVVGQPHLEHVAEIIAERRKLSTSTARLVFFSEPIVESPEHAHPIGYTQFSVATELLAALAPIEGVSLIIKPHPNETLEPWRDWLNRNAPRKGLDIHLDTTESLTLIAQAHGVIGMASLALIEAAVGGIPALALQPGRLFNPRGGIDGDPAIRLVANSNQIATAVREFMASIAKGYAMVESSHRFAGSTERVMAALSEAVDNAAKSPPLEINS